MFVCVVGVLVNSFVLVLNLCLCLFLVLVLFVLRFLLFTIVLLLDSPVRRNFMSCWCAMEAEFVYSRKDCL